MRVKLPILVFAVTAAVGAFLTITTYNAGAAANRLRFERIADDALDRIGLRIGQHISLLTATRALVEIRDGNVSYAGFSGFVGHLNTEDAYDGVQGIGYAAILPPGSEADVEAGIAQNYGITRAVFPETDQPVRTAITMLEPPDIRNRAALGFDMYTEPTRRAAMMNAAQTGEARASGRVELVQEIDGQKQSGFLVYLPFYADVSRPGRNVPGADPRLAGFIYAPFRVNDLIAAAWARMPGVPVHLEIYDTIVSPKNLMYQGTAPAAGFGDEYVVHRTINVAGREWQAILSPAVGFAEGPEKGIALVLGAVSLLMAAALAVSLRAQMKALDASREVLRVTEAAATEKDFLLQEMKHRIKNSIARMLAIARQTARHSDTIESFIASFTNRLQAMAASQDLLTRSHSETAVLADLLEGEMFQVFGEGFEAYASKGPRVELGVRATQALGLVFHELATNALKYGEPGEADNSLAVNWTRSGPGAPLVIDWQELTARPAESTSSGGFGTKLIVSLVRGELNGTVERTLTDAGLHVRIEIPAAALAN